MKRAGRAEFRWIANITLARRRDVLQPRRGAHAGFIGRGEENLCGDSRWQVVLLAMKNRNFSPSLSRPCLRAAASSPFTSSYPRCLWTCEQIRREIGDSCRGSRSYVAKQLLRCAASSQRDTARGTIELFPLMSTPKRKGEISITSLFVEIELAREFR